MAEYKFGDGLKKVFLAGVGAIAISAEKGSELISELVKKGELTVEQGKDLNKDLQRGFKESMDKKGINIDELGQKFTKMSTDELAKIKEQIANAEKVVSEKIKQVDEAVNDFAQAAEERADEVSEKLEEAFASGVDAAEEAVEEAKEKAEAIVEEAKETAAAAVEEAEEAAEEAAPEEEKPAEE